MAVRIVRGKRQIDRAGIAQEAGVGIRTVDQWRRHADFPEQIDGKWWDEDAARNFIAKHRLTKKRALTSVNCEGDPDELVTSTEAARVLGYETLDSIPLGLRDLADEIQALPSGRKRRRYKRRTLWEYADSRTGKQSTGRRRTRTVDRSGDPEELVGAGEAARTLGYTHRDQLPVSVRQLADSKTTGADGRVRRKWKRKALWNWDGTQTDSA